MKQYIATSLGALWVLLGVTALAPGCGDGMLTLSVNGEQDGLKTQPQRLDAQCTDVLSCCPAEHLVCSGNPDDRMTCQCDLWACEQPGETRCWRTLPLPSGTTRATSCSWDEFSYSCDGELQASETPQDVEGWDCTVDSANGTWHCVAAFAPNPSDLPSGASSYTCEPDLEFGLLTCTALADPSSSLDTPSSTEQGGSPLAVAGRTGTSGTYEPGHVGGASAAPTGSAKSSTGSGASPTIAGASSP